GPRPLPALISKALITVKLTAILFMFCFQAGAAVTLAQTVTLTERNVPLSTVFKEIHRQTGYEFLATSEVFEESKPVRLNVKDAFVERVLSMCLDTQALEYTIDEKVIVIRKRLVPHRTEEEVSVTLPVKLTVSGQVLNRDGETLPGVNVIEKGTTNGTAT